MPKDKVIFLMIGIPGSGKTTIRETQLEYLGDYVVISSDDYIEFFAAAAGSTYSEVFSTAIKHADSHINHQLEYALKHGKNIVWDQTNLTTKKRKYVLSKIPDDYKRVAIFVDPPLQVALQRNSERSRKVPEEVIEKMYNSLELPQYAEGFDQIIRY